LESVIFIDDLTPLAINYETQESRSAILKCHNKIRELKRVKGFSAINMFFGSMRSSRNTMKFYNHELSQLIDFYCLNQDKARDESCVIDLAEFIQENKKMLNKFKDELK
jgi:hypothetical protein